MKQRDAIAEACAEAPERLRRQRDLGNEDDRAASGCERRGAGADVDLGLAAAGRALEQDVSAVTGEKRLDPRQRALLCFGEMLGRRLGGQRRPGRHLPPFTAPRRLVGSDKRQRAGRRGTVVVGEPEGEVDERRRKRLEHAVGRDGIDVGRRLCVGVDDDAAALGVAEANGEDGSLPHLVLDLVGKEPRERASVDDRVDRGETRHGQRA